MEGYTDGLCTYSNRVPQYDASCEIASSAQSGLTSGGGSCAVDVNECASGPCQNDALCSDSTSDPSIPTDSYRCACQPGWTGSECAVDINECASSPCVNGAACSDSTDADSDVVVGAYSCTCVDGFASGICAYNDVIPQYEDQCAIVGSLQIGLSAGAGNCEVDVDECASTPCANDQPCFESTSVGVNMPISDWRCDCGGRWCCRRRARWCCRWRKC